MIDLIDFWCFNATFNNISAISWRPVLVVEEAGENHRRLVFYLSQVYPLALLSMQGEGPGWLNELDLWI
jgi:hypothetical protein